MQIIFIAFIMNLTVFRLSVQSFGIPSYQNLYNIRLNSTQLKVYVKQLSLQMVIYCILSILRLYSVSNYFILIFRKILIHFLKWIRTESFEILLYPRNSLFECKQSLVLVVKSKLQNLSFLRQRFDDLRPYETFQKVVCNPKMCLDSSTLSSGSTNPNPQIFLS